MKSEKKWWQKAVFYQIYPRSFSDSTNNGIGDLKGIITKLDYLKDLGINAIWFSPFFKSPQKDFGYDISDYCSINPEYGTMEDFDLLLLKAHECDLKVILDMVLNHTSDEHPWFIESKLNRTNPKNDWYIWLDGKGKENKKPPNNWKAIIGGSSWEWCEERQQFYLHQFLPFQPDLNWRNVYVQEAMIKSLQYWLDKGVDGFRLDIIHRLFEDKDFNDNPRSKQFFPSDKTTAYLFQYPKYTQFLPETIKMCLKLRKIIDSYSPPRMLVGEAVGGPHIFKPLYGKNNNGLNLVFNFKIENQPFSANKFRKVIQETEKFLPDPYWPCYVFSNHDVKRMISRHGNNIFKAKLLTLLLLTLRGTPFIYYGEEIGMNQVKIPPSQLKDPVSKLRIFSIPIGRFFGRDGCRTPMQWNDTPVNAGFSSDQFILPWLPIHSNASVINVLKQKNDSASMLSFYKKILQLRKEEKALNEGSIKIVDCNISDFLMYKRELNSTSCTIILNFSKKNKKVLSKNYYKKMLLTTYPSFNILSDQKEIELRPYEGLILK